MYEKIIEIIVFVITELTQNKKISDIDLNKLASLGYTTEEISTAFSWLIDRMDYTNKAKNEYTSQDLTSFRILNSIEADLFTQEAWGEIMNLKTLGILNNQQIENIIDWASFMSMSPVDLYQIRNYVAFNILNVQSYQKNGSRFMLLGNETIN